MECRVSIDIGINLNASAKALTQMGLLLCFSITAKRTGRTLTLVHVPRLAAFPRRFNGSSPRQQIPLGDFWAPQSYRKTERD